LFGFFAGWFRRADNCNEQNHASGVVRFLHSGIPKMIVKVNHPKAR